MKLKKMGPFFIFSLGLLLLQVYQNCSQTGFRLTDPTGALDMSSEILLDTSHPAAASANLPTQKILVANKTYVAALMRDIFSRTANDTDLENLIHQWVVSRPAQFGGSCNIYDSYSQRDCGGDVSNVNLPQQTDHNTVRESFQIQFCENILGTDDYVNAVISKIEKTATAPDASGIAQIYALFYRGQDADQATIDTLIDLDHSLAQKQEPIIDRWRAVILQVCESPGWQLL